MRPRIPPRLLTLAVCALAVWGAAYQVLAALPK